MKTHPFQGQILELGEIGVKKEIKKVKNSMAVFRGTGEDVLLEVCF